MDKQSTQPLPADPKERHKEQTRRWFLAHPGYAATRYRANPARGRAKAKKWRQSLSAEKKAQIAEQNRLRCAKWRAENPDYMRKYLKQYAKQKAEKLGAIRRNYKSRKKNAPGRHTEADVLAILERQSTRCFWCYCDVSNGYTVDHVIPLVRGGSNNPDNLVIACAKCNSSRRHRLPHEWKQMPKRKAQELFPGLPVTHAIADALLIAEYGRRSEARSGLAVA